MNLLAVQPDSLKPIVKKGKLNVIVLFVSGVFSLFSVVTFPNGQCTTKTDKTMVGTCYTSSECNGKGGTSDGNCAGGFGVCCMITISSCGGTISRNLTYITNPGFPTGVTTSTACTYTISPTQSGICQIRLDFNNFATLAPASGICGAGTFDSLVITSPTAPVAANLIPAICGTNTGQHIYIETGSASPSATLTFNFGTTAGTRSWKILVSQIECWNLGKAPSDCLQYLIGTSGTFMSFNYAATGNLLSSLNYNICFRQEEGYCSIDISESPNTTPDAFQLGASAMGQIGPAICTVSGIIVPSDITLGAAGVYCGAYLVTVIGQTFPSVIREVGAPFTVGVYSVAAGSANSIGFNLMYSEVPCN